MLKLFSSAAEGLASLAASRNYLSAVAGAGTVLVVLGAIDSDQAKGLVDGAQQFMDGIGQAVGGAKKILIIVGPVVMGICAKYAGLSATLRGRLTSIAADPTVKIEGKIIAPAAVADAVPSNKVVAGPTAAIALLIGGGMLLALLLPGATANAQPKFPQLPFKAPSQISDDIRSKFAQFEQITIADLTAAKQIFDAAKNTNGSACAGAWLTLAQANATIDAAALPDPHVFSFLAKAYNLHVALQTGAPLRTACAAMKDDLNSGLLGIGGGATAVTKLVPALAMFGL